MVVDGARAVGVVTGAQADDGSVNAGELANLSGDETAERLRAHGVPCVVVRS